jgi:hypothetical protein
VFVANPGQSTGNFVNRCDADYVIVSNTDYTLVTANNMRVIFLKSGSSPGPYSANSVTDGKRNVTALTYTTVGGKSVLTRVADPSGHYLQINYTAFGTNPYITSVVTSDEEAFRTLTAASSLLV